MLKRGLVFALPHSRPNNAEAWQFPVSMVTFAYPAAMDSSLGLTRHGSVVNLPWPPPNSGVAGMSDLSGYSILAS